MIKTKLFTGSDTTKANPGNYVECDGEINEFLEENNVEIIDIKFTSTYNNDQIWNSALMIYKEK
ncbi:hypothetical protein ACBZ92_01975 [Priestia aryabhattai]|uniref:hypothetical protein n=1 Tax=Priestia aryabhattai TaxID=412384 RepID=UPI003562654E